MKKFLKGYDTFERYLDAVFVFALIALGFLQVLSRYVFNMPLAWTEEVSLFIFIWMIYIGSATAVTDEKHVAVDLFVNFLPERIRRWEAVFVDAIWMFFCVMLVISTETMFTMSIQRHAATIASKIPYALGYLAIMIGAVLMFFRLLYKGVKKDIPFACAYGKEENK